MVGPWPWDNRRPSSTQRFPVPSALPNFPACRVLVAGDVMLDRYWHGAATRISPEAPVPVVLVEDDEQRAGGAANVAVNITALGAGATLVGLVGADEAGALLRARLDTAHVDCRLIETASHPTITKLRVLSHHQQLLRLDFETPFNGPETAAVAETFAQSLAGHRAVVLSDYAKGTLAEVERLIAAARARGVPVIVDPKGTDFDPYAGATVLTPNLAEFEAVVGRCRDDVEIEAHGAALRERLGLEALVVTRGERGLTLVQRDYPPLHLPALARDVFDRTGAGDTVVAVLGAGLAAGLSIGRATVLANVAAGLVVGKLGTATVAPAELAVAVEDFAPGRAVR